MVDGETIGGTAMLTTGVGLVTTGVSLLGTQLVPAVVTVAVGFAFIGIGIYLIQKGIMTKVMKKLGK